MKTKHPVYIMVFEVLTRDGDIMPPFIFPYGFRLNRESYIKYLEEVGLVMIERVAAERPHIWQKDCAMPHKQKNPILACQKNSVTKLLLTSGHLTL